MVITKIEAQKKNPLRENIFLDGEFAFGISAELRFLSKLRVGDDLTNSQVERLIKKDQVAKMVEKALKFLAYRPRSEKEVRQNLILKRKSPGEPGKSELELKSLRTSIDEAINFLIKHKQIDDHQFALWWVEGRRKFKKVGDQVIKSELFAKGISKDLINQVLEEKMENPEELALAAAQKKLASYSKLDPKEFKIKMGQYLVRRGFSWDTVSSVVDTLLKKD